MKPILFIIVAVLLCNVGEGQPKTDWATFPIKGKVKSVRTKETYRYMKNGVFTEWAPSYRQFTQFNNTGFRTEYSEFTGNDSLSYKIAYAYYPREKRADVSYFDKTLKPTTRTIYKYNDKGYKIEEWQNVVDGKPNYRYTYAYDDRGNWIEMAGYKPDGTMSSKTTWTFDKNNYPIEYKVETPGYANSSRKFINDDRGNVTEETWHDGKEAITFRFVRTYDANGNKVKEVKYKGADKLLDTVTWRYEYDKQGNWIKSTQTTAAGDDFHIKERTIVYY